MKKIITLILAGCIALSTTACTIEQAANSAVDLVMKRSAVRLRSLAPRNCPRIWLYSFVWGLFVCPYTFLIIKRFFDFVLYLSFKSVIKDNKK